MSVKQFINPFVIFINLWIKRELIGQLIKRDISIRYKGSYLGFIWSIIMPVFMLTVYTFVFSVIFQAKWGTSSGNKAEFAMLLFCGLNAYNFFSECINRAPTLIITNPNYVKKVVFPLEILPIVMIGSAAFHAGIGFIVLLIGILSFLSAFHWTLIFLPLVMLPLFLLVLGLSWFLASLGVYLRDIGQIMGVFTTVLLFLSPIFYPLSSIPENLLRIYYLNPITYVVEDTRRILVWGQMPQWSWLLIEICVSIIVFIFGYLWFRKTQKGFADVL